MSVLTGIVEYHRIVASETVSLATIFVEVIRMYRIMRKINLVSRCQTLYLADQLRDTGIGPCHHSYLLTIARRPGISQEELAKEICVNKSSVARNLANLENQGYIERKSSPQDKRVLQYCRKCGWRPKHGMPI